jgi:hypothetical protein
VQLQSVDPPEQVIAAFKDVTAAQQDQNRLRNEAEAYANRLGGVRRGSSGKRRRRWRTTSDEHERSCGAMSDALSIMMCRSRGHSLKSRAERAHVRTSR